MPKLEGQADDHDPRAETEKNSSVPLSAAERLKNRNVFDVHQEYPGAVNCRKGMQGHPVLRWESDAFRSIRGGDGPVCKRCPPRNEVGVSG